MQIYFLILDKTSNKINSQPTTSKFKQRVRKSHTHNISKVANSTTAKIYVEELWACGFLCDSYDIWSMVGYWFLTPVNIFQMPYSEPV